MARGGRYQCYRCGHRFISYQREDAFGPVSGCESCGSHKVHAVTSLGQLLGCMLVPLVVLGLLIYLGYRLWW